MNRVRRLQFGATVLAITLAMPALGGAVAAAQTILRQDPSATGTKFRADTLVQTIVLRGAVLEIHAEEDSAHQLTGRYLVRRTWPTTPAIIAADTEGFSYDGPGISLVAEGEPTVIMLASYTGGMGRDAVTSYTFKLLILADTTVRAYTLEDSGPDTAFFTADLVGFSRGPAQGFSIRLKGGTTIRYDRRTLTWSRMAAR